MNTEAPTVEDHDLVGELRSTIVSSQDPITTQCWLELEDLVHWPIEKKIRKTRNRNIQNVSVHFADEKGGQLAEVQLVKAFKKRTDPVVWCWWAVETEEEARQWPSCRPWPAGNCWIVSEQVPPPPPMVHRKSTEDSVPAMAGQSAPAQADTQTHKVIAMASQNSQNRVGVQEVLKEEPSDKEKPSEEDHDNSQRNAVVSNGNVISEKESVPENCSGNDHSKPGSEAQSSDKPSGKDHGKSGSEAHASQWSVQNIFEDEDDSTSGTGAFCEERSDKVHGSSQVEASDSEWCEALCKSLQAEDSVARSNGLTYLLSTDGIIMSLALSPHGYHVILQAVAVAPCGPHAEQRKIISALQGNVKELISSPYGCEVLQTCVECAVPSAVSFIVTELEGSACSIARAPGQYELICRLLEHLPSSATESFVSELLGEVRGLCCHPRGNHVVQHLVEYGTPAQQRSVCTVVASDLLTLARHRVASHVVEKAVEASDLAAKSLVAQAALSQKDMLLTLACTRQSQFVAQRLLRHPGAEGHAVRRVLCNSMEHLKASKYGSRIAESLVTFLGAMAGA